jgi:hypothetical protein
VYGKPSFQTYYQNIGHWVHEKLEREAPDYLLRVDPEEYLNYLVAEAEWQPLEWADQSEWSVEPITVKVERRDEFERERTYVVDEHRFRLRIPIAPHPQREAYFKYLPTAHPVRSEPQWRFQGNTLIVEVEATQAAVDRVRVDLQTWLGQRNRDIGEGNRRLDGLIRPVWEGKRKRLEEQHGKVQAELQKLNIRLHQDPNAKAKPVEIRPRQLKTVIQKPTPKARPEPTLQRDQVVGLVDFIEGYARQFEVAPREYADRGEESLRNMIVAMLNANYPGSATAETFNKLGKTDIRLRVDEGDVLICECKVWSGQKAYVQAIEQLFGYLTWRQNYGVLITFCRLKDMSAAIDQATKAVTSHASYVVGSVAAQSRSRFSTRHTHPQDAGKLLEIFHLFVDLSV